MELDIKLDLPKNEEKKPKVKIDIGKIDLSIPDEAQPQKRPEIHDADLDIFDMTFEIGEAEPAEQVGAREHGHQDHKKKKKKFWPFSR